MRFKSFTNCLTLDKLIHLSLCPSLPNYKKCGQGELWCLPHRIAGKVYEVTKHKTLMAVGLLNYGHHDLTYPFHHGHP